MASELREAAATLDEDSFMDKKNVLMLHQNSLSRRLSDVANHSETTIPISNLVDIVQRDCSNQEEAYAVLSCLDTEGDGIADVETAKEIVKNLDSTAQDTALANSVRTLQSCIHVPGFVDIYTGEEDRRNALLHSQKLITYLLKHRACSSSFPLLPLRAFSSTHSMRKAVIKAYSKDLTKPKPTSSEFSMFTDKPFQRIVVSSNEKDAHYLLDSNCTTYWQSEGVTGTHFIRLIMLPQVNLSKLFLNVSTYDSTYMPNLVVVSAGPGPESLKEISRVNIPSNFKGDFLLLDYSEGYFAIVQINIRRTQSDGNNTRVRGIRVEGIQFKKDTSTPSAFEASQILLAEFLFTTAKLMTQVVPDALNTYVNHCSTALSNMPPLSLSGSFSASSHVFDRIHQQVSEMAKGDRKVALLLFSYNIARGHLAGIFQSLIYLSKLNCSGDSDNSQLLSLVKSMKTVLREELRQQSDCLDVQLSETDGSATSNSDYLFSTNWTSQTISYTSSPEKSCLTFQLKSTTETDENIMLTKFRIRFAKGGRAARRVLVFLKNDEDTSSYSDLDNKSVEEIDKMVEDKKLYPKPDLYLKVLNEWDELEYVLTDCPQGDTVIMKLIGLKDPDKENIAVISMHLFGLYMKKPRLLPVLDKFCENCSNIGQLTESLLIFVFCLIQKRKCRKLSARDLSVTNVYDFYSLISIDQQLLLLEIFYLFLADLQGSKEDKGAKKLCHHLFSIVNDEDEERSKNSKFLSLSEMILVEGANVFFPDTNTRTKQLIDMLNAAKEQHETSQVKKSVGLSFRSLCSYFIKNEPWMLLQVNMSLF